MGNWMRTRSRSRWTAMKLRAQAIRAAWHGDAETSARLLRAASDAGAATKGET